MNSSASEPLLRAARRLAPAGVLAAALLCAPSIAGQTTAPAPPSTGSPTAPASPPVAVSGAGSALYRRELAAKRRTNDINHIIQEEMISIEEAYRRIIDDKTMQNLYAASSASDPDEAARKVREQLFEDSIARSREVVLLVAAREARMERYVTRDEIDTALDHIRREAELGDWERVIAERLKSGSLTTEAARSEIRDQIMVEKYIAVKVGAYGLKLLPDLPALHDTYVSPTELQRYFWKVHREAQRKDRLHFHEVRLPVLSPATTEETLARANAIQAALRKRPFADVATEFSLPGSAEPRVEPPGLLPKETADLLQALPEGGVSDVTPVKDPQGEVRAYLLYSLVKRDLHRFDDPKYQEQLRRELWMRKLDANRMRLFYELLREATISSPVATDTRDAFLAHLRRKTRELEE
ncbi:MAG: hypothetical protein HY719_08450 [Planctomycetes bacterium]|nr:hypothetical protein [Planctomycetota bacterium]